MFFLLSKILGFFALPSNLLITFALLGVLLLPTRFARAGRGLAATSILLLAVVGFSPLGNILILPLEQRFPPWDDARGAPHGIIVLGGALTPAVSAGRGTIELNEAAERMTAAVDLARRYPAARIAFSGGDPTVAGNGQAEAVFAARFFQEHGIARERLDLEDRARNTTENARFTKGLVKPGERWLLVTSAYHMPRSMAVFRHEGVMVEPYPVDWRTAGARDSTALFTSLADGLKRTDMAMREWVGLLAYRLAGRTSELLPGP
jgi:uncharacterized SAM-binding protein YcdF (DUF218 family)